MTGSKKTPIPFWHMNQGIINSKKTEKKNSFPWILFLISFIFNLIVGVWTLTQKVEAEKQRAMADNARVEALKQRELAEMEALKQREAFLVKEKEALIAEQKLKECESRKSK